MYIGVYLDVISLLSHRFDYVNVKPGNLNNIYYRNSGMYTKLLKNL